MHDSVQHLRQLASEVSTKNTLNSADVGTSNTETLSTRTVTCRRNRQWPTHKEAQHAGLSAALERAGLRDVWSSQAERAKSCNPSTDRHTPPFCHKPA